MFRERMRLDDPVMVRYFTYIKNALHGDFGVSDKLNREISDLIMIAFPHTIKPVSYTHLDVYKRQRVMRASISACRSWPSRHISKTRSGLPLT